MRAPDRPPWRWLDTGARDGATNMAIDEALLEVYAARGGRPILRFYSWSPPTVSLGYGQAVESAVALDRCRALGIDVVRRPTGGRAVLHEHEVTYSVVIRDDDPLAAMGILASYLTISRALIRGLSYLGVAATLIPLQRPAVASPVCFATPSSYEVAVAGRKLIGSAQRRRPGAIMQHGSLPLSLDRDRLFAVLRCSENGGMGQGMQAYGGRMISLQEAGGRAYSYAEVVAALGRGFAETWQTELVADALTAEEQRLSDHLRETKYGSEAWTWHRRSPEPSSLREGPLSA
jgi:lipoate-protein ligase A